jgi:hypothetical protein
MTLPVAYSGTIKVSGTAARYLAALDPQNWRDNVPEIWNASYLIAPSGVPSDSLPLASRAASPASVPQKKLEWDAWQKFFEDVTVVGLRFRNVLETRFRRWKNPDGGVRSFQFEYRQYDCLTTESIGGVDDGGIDVDYGGSKCWPAGNGEVWIEIAKTVRYTEPSYLYGELNGLSYVLTPLVFDGWLHSMLFGNS